MKCPHCNKEIKKQKKKPAEIHDIPEMLENMKIGLDPLCPECGRQAFPTNFPATAFGGSKNDKRTVWSCSDMGHCMFAVNNKTEWQKKGGDPKI